MKKLTTYNELKPESPNCEYGSTCMFTQGEGWDLGDQGSFAGVKAICFKPLVLRFIDDAGRLWKRCFKQISGYPRDVPERVAELPEELPQLAYLGKLRSSELNQGAVGSIYVEMPYGGWVKIEQYSNTGYEYNIAIDVSTEWSAENFPEFVEAMEYKPIYGDIDRILIGHKLGKDTYAPDWRKLNHIAKTHNKYRKKPVEVEAIQWYGHQSNADVKAFAGSKFKITKTGSGILTLNGFAPITEGEWIIKGVNGEFYPCKPDIFEKTYEEMSEL